MGRQFDPRCSLPAFLMFLCCITCFPCAMQDLMKSAPDVTNVVEACGEERQGRLESMLQQLEFCEKALQVS